jgi:predicted Zn-dependent protease
VWAASGAPETRLQAGYQLANQWVQRGRLREAQDLLNKLHAEFPDNEDVNVALRLVAEVVHEQHDAGR